MLNARLKDILIITEVLIIGIIIGCTSTTPSKAVTPVEQPEYEYAYGWGMLETEGDAIFLDIPELETIDGEWGEMEVYKTFEFPIAFEGGAQGTEMWAINEIADLGWELVSKYYVNLGHEKGHHYWFRRVKVK